jgi:hypothetical protein
MALKLKITKEAYDKLSDGLKGEYVERDGEYVLDVDGVEDTGALKRAKDRETQMRKDAEAKIKELQELIDTNADVDARKRGDIEPLEKAWQGKLDNATKGLTDRLSALQKSTSAAMIDKASSDIASKISTVPALMSKAVRERLTVDFEGDSPVLRILDATGKPSALTLDELSAEFVANKDYSSIIIASKASGSGAAKDGFAKANGGATANNSDKQTMLSKLPAKDFAAMLKDKIENKG